MEDTWAIRDLPVLDAVVTLLDRPGSIMATVREIAAHTGMDPADVVCALDALDGTYVEFKQFAGGNQGSWRVRRVSPDARRAVGQWPTAESLIARLADGFSAAAEREADPEEKKRLRAVARGLGGAGRQVAIDLVARMIEHATGTG